MPDSVFRRFEDKFRQFEEKAMQELDDLGRQAAAEAAAARRLREANPAERVSAECQRIEDEKFLAAIGKSPDDSPSPCGSITREMAAKVGHLEMPLPINTAVDRLNRLVGHSPEAAADFARLIEQRIDALGIADIAHAPGLAGDENGRLGLLGVLNYLLHPGKICAVFADDERTLLTHFVRLS